MKRKESKSIVVNLIEAKPTPEQSKGVMKIVFLGQCYRMTAEYVFRHPGARLIHGTIRHRQGPLAGKAIEHAWVDLEDGKVFDGVLQKFFEKKSYYRFWQAKEKRSFSQIDAAKLLVSGDSSKWRDESNRASLTDRQRRLDKRVKSFFRVRLSSKASANERTKAVRLLANALRPDMRSRQRELLEGS